LSRKQDRITVTWLRDGAPSLPPAAKAKATAAPKLSWSARMEAATAAGKVSMANRKSAVTANQKSALVASAGLFSEELKTRGAERL
jgi:hypothetical protein